MPRGDKSAYTDKQKRKAGYIEESYKKRGMPEDEAAARAWAIVNKIHGGGELSGSGRGKPENKEVYKKGGRKGGAAKRKTTAKKSVKRTKAKKSRTAANAAKAKARSKIKGVAARKRKPKARKRRS